MHIHYIHMFLIYQRLIVDLYLFLSMVLLTDRWPIFRIRYNFLVILDFFWEAHQGEVVYLLVCGAEAIPPVKVSY